MTFYGGQAAGAAAWGALADRTTPVFAIMAAAAVLIASGLAAAVCNLPPNLVRTLELSARSLGPDWSVPPSANQGRLWVYVEYEVTSPEGVDTFHALLPQLRRSRRRTGSRHWRVLTDPDRPAVIVETFMVQSWGERVRQLERHNNPEDRALSNALAELTTSMAVRHLFESGER